MSGSTISGTVTTEVTLGSALHSSPLTITAAGEVSVAGTAIYNSLTAGLLVNYGEINSATGTSGADAVIMKAGTFENDGIVIGAGTSSQLSTSPVNATVYIENGVLTNAGTISGGVGGAGEFSASRGGIGVDITGQGENSGVITGGVGGPKAAATGFGTGGVGGIGLDDFGNFTNASTGIIAGGAGYSSTTASADSGGGIGAYVIGTMLNYGTILGGAAQGTTQGGEGASVIGTLINLGTIESGSNSGTLGQIGVSVSSGEIVNSGLIEGAEYAVKLGSSATLVVDATARFIGTIEAVANSGDILELAGTSSTDFAGVGISINNFSTIEFQSGAAWTISGDYTGTASYAGFNAANEILGFSRGDKIDVNNFSATSAAYIAGTGLVLSNATTSETIKLVGSFAENEFTISSDGTGGTEIVTCFSAGTRIQTPEGEVPVELLTIGDEVTTLHSGARRIKWIGERSYCQPFMAPHRVQPIFIKPNAIADGVPTRDLLVSPGHAICIDGVLIRASRLVNGSTITQANVPTVHYYHIELDTHEIILADGCPAETFQDESLRNAFQNVHEFVALYPKHTAPMVSCLPVLDGGFHLDAILRRLEERAGLESKLAAPGPIRGYVDKLESRHICGWAQDSSQPESPVCLEILADGRRIALALANEWRGDVFEAGYGSGNCGWSVTLTEPMAGAVTVRRVQDGATLEHAANLRQKAA